MDFDPGAFAQIGSVPAWGSFFVLVGWIVRTWPHWKEKINEARKIQLDADGVLRTDLLTRIRELEEGRSADRREFNEEMSKERKRCDIQLEEIRKEMNDLKDDNRGLLAMIRQNSSSTALMISRPDAVAEIEARKGVVGKPDDNSVPK